MLNSWHSRAGRLFINEVLSITSQKIIIYCQWHLNYTDTQINTTVVYMMWVAATLISDANITQTSRVMIGVAT